MNFDLTDRAKDYLERVTAFMDECVYPAEHVYEAQMRESGDPHFQPPMHRGAQGRGPCARPLEPLPPASWSGARGLTQRGVRAAGRD